MPIPFEAVPNSSTIAEEVGRYSDITIDGEVKKNQGKYSFRLSESSGRFETLKLDEDLVEDLGGKYTEHRMSQLKWKVRELVTRLR